jgi:biopolymer transport protein ExbD
MRLQSKQRQAELNTSSVADIAFLLLSFFLMTTVISEDKGLALNLPEWRDKPIEKPVAERNLFKIQLNSSDEAMIEGERVIDLIGLRAKIKNFILNNGRDPLSSDSPQHAIISLKSDRGTSHGFFISTLDEIQAAYYEIYAENAGMTTEAYRRLDYSDKRNKHVIERAKNGIPMNISLAEPSSVLSRP